MKRRFTASRACGSAFLIAAVFAVAGLATPQPAEAHDWTLWHGCRGPYGCMGSARTFDNHTKLRVCDTKVDGNRVRGWYNLAQYQFPTGWAPSGGCIYWAVAYSYTAFNVCVQRHGCAGWAHR